MPPTGRWFKSDEWKEMRRLENKLSARNRRNAAIEAMGGRCGCGESDPAKLLLIAKTDEDKGLSQVVFYKVIILSDFKEERAELICKRCRINRSVEERLAKEKELGIQKENPGTGVFYWVGGQKVEQMRRGGIVTVGNVITSWRAMEHYDLGIDQLYKRD
jgi:hypothetical protein